MGPVRKAHPLDKLQGAARGLVVGQGLRGIGQRQDHVFKGAGARQQIEVLKHEPDFFIAHMRPLIARQIGHLLPVQHIPAAGGPVKAAQDIHERAFAGAGGARERHQLALLDRERDALEHRHVKLAQMIGLVYIVKLDYIHACIEFDSMMRIKLRIFTIPASRPLNC